MEFSATTFQGLYLIKPKIFNDSRGYFFESFKLEAFKEAGISFVPEQENESRSSEGVIRGLHYQMKPYDQAKLVRVVEGRIFDVALDIRSGSLTFGKWFGIELDAESKIQIFIPRGFAHGFSVLSGEAVVQYKIDNQYNRQAERGISLNDPALAIDWRLGNRIPLISDKDMNNPFLAEADYNF